MRSPIPAMVLFAALCTTFTVSGQDAEAPNALDAARAAHEAGAAASAAGRYAEAEAHFREAFRLSQRESARYNLGLVLEEQGKFAEAVDIYEELVRLPTTDLPAPRAELEADRVRAESQLATIEVQVEGAERATVRVDGEEAGVVGEGASLTLRRDPGAHELEARAGERAARTTLTLARGERRRVRLVLESETPATPPAPTLDPAAAAATEVPAPSGNTEPLEGEAPGRAGVHPAVWVVIAGVVVAGVLTAVLVTRGGDAGYEAGPFAPFEN